MAKLRSFVVYDKEETIDLGGSFGPGEAILASARRHAMGLPVMAKTDDNDEEPITEAQSALLAGICRKPGPCPCQEPCRWGEQALESIQRDRWPPRD